MKKEEMNDYRKCLQSLNEWYHYFGTDEIKITIHEDFLLIKNVGGKKKID